MSEVAADRLVWLDMEMTGLDPETCVPLEVAIIITGSDLAELATFEAVTTAEPGALESMDDFVRDMHTRNGLLDRAAASTRSLDAVDDDMAALVMSWCEPQTGVLAGNSIWQDRRFVRRYFPKLEAALHYRMIDVSTIKELTRRWYPESLPPKSSDHTAMADIRASIAELMHYKKTIFK